MTVASVLSLRAIRAEDAIRIHEWASLPVACRYQPWGPNTWPQTQAFVDAAIRAWKSHPQQRWVWAAVDSTELAVGLGEARLRGSGRIEISYAVHVDHWGQGLGSAIARTLTRWSFEAMPAVERVEGTCDPRNTASEAVLRRTGMTYEGTLRHTVRIRDGWRDSKVFSILRNEWSPGEPAPLRVEW